MTDPLDDPLVTLSGLLHETATGLRQSFEGSLQACSELSPSRFEVLLRLARSEGQRLRLSDLAAQTLFSKSGLTRLVDGLEAEGLVERDSCDADGRVTWAQLTQAGRERVEKALPAHRSTIQQSICTALSADEVEQLEQLLRKLRDQVHPGATQT